MKLKQLIENVIKNIDVEMSLINKIKFHNKTKSKTSFKLNIQTQLKKLLL